ncbi:hypothetical protein KAU11_02725 [Candidatus Babeliales bacterium]|nr:hypothetical protein [Candidatus Babeliales bacterium]
MIVWIFGGGLAAVCAAFFAMWAYRNFVGVLEGEEKKKFGLLALTFFSIIGVYTMMKMFKDAFFIELVGVRYIPAAKLVSPIIFTLVLLLYNKIIPIFRKHKLFIIVCSFYAAIYAGMGYLYSHPSILTISPYVAWIPGKVLGWAGYVLIESFGGLVVNALFWAFVASTTTTVSAKRGYPLVFLMAQLGNLAGASIVSRFAVVLDFHGLFYLASIIIFFIPTIVETLVKTVPKKLMQSDEGKRHKKQNPGILEGLKLILGNGYVAGMLVVATFYEIIGTILDYQFKSAASAAYSGSALASFMGTYGMVLGTMTMIFALVGTSFVIRFVGVCKGILLYPVLLSVVVVLGLFYPSLSTFFVAMLVVKSMSYTLNNPVKELLYLPTSDDVKFKSKSFIDGIGGKTFKAIGSGFNIVFGSSILIGGAVACFGVLGIWIFVGIAMGKRYDVLISNHEIVG